MELTFAPLSSLHGQHNPDKSITCHLNFKSNVANDLWITLPIMSLAVEKQLKDLERAVCKFFGVKAIEQCVGLKAELVEFVNVYGPAYDPVSPCLPTTEIVVLKRGENTLNLAKWCRTTFGGLYETALNKYVQQQSERRTAFEEFYNARVSGTIKLLALSKLEG